MVLALLLNLLAPLLAHAALRGSQAAERFEVCSASGMVWLNSDGDPASGPAADGSTPAGHGLPDCAWCALHHGTTPALPPAQVGAGEFDARLSSQLPRPAHCRLTALAVWHPAQSRAPPLSY